MRKGGPPTRTGCGITFCLHMEKPRLRKVARAEGTSCSFSQAPQVCTHEGLGVSQPRPVSPSPSCRATNAAGSVASAAPFPDTYEHLVSKPCPQQREQVEEKEQGQGARATGLNPGHTGMETVAPPPAPAVGHWRGRGGAWALLPGSLGFKLELH